MKQIGIISCFILISMSASAFSDKCVEVGATAVLDFLTKQEPTSDVHLTKNAKGDITGIVDSADVYASMDLSDVIQDGKNLIIIFKEGSFIAFSHVEEVMIKGTLSCKVTHVDTGQDDED